MKHKILYQLSLAASVVLPLGGCMAWTDGMDTVSGSIYTDYNPFGSLYFGPDGYYQPYAGPVSPAPIYRPVFGYPSWGGGIPPSIDRPYPGPSNRPGTGGNPGIIPGRPSGSGQRPGANITTLPDARPVEPVAQPSRPQGTRPESTSRR